MKFIAIAIFVPVLSSSVAALQPVRHGEALEEGMVNPGYQDKPEWFKASFLGFREGIDEATAA